MSQTKAQLLDGKSATIQFTGGSASAPSVSFTGDTNTGIYSPGADQVAISTGGSGRVFINADGLGIGVSSPTNKLQISGATANALLNGTSNSYIGCDVNSSNVGFVGDANWMFGGSSTNFGLRATNNLVFGIGLNERMRLDSSGRLGIGTSTPNVKTEVSGTEAAVSLRVNSQNAGVSANNYSEVQLADNGALRSYWRNVRDGSGSTQFAYNSSLAFLSDANGTPTERFRCDTSGRLLVGTSSSPASGNGNASYIVVQGFVGTPAGAGFLSLQRGETATNITTDEGIGVLSFNDSNGNAFADITCRADANAGVNDYPGRLVFSTTADGASSPTERMRIAQNGRIAFGGQGAPYSSATCDTYNNGSGEFAHAFRQDNATGFGIGIGIDGTFLAYFYSNKDLSGAPVGSISQNGTTTAYNTSSDYRLKENINAVTDGITRLQQLKPSRFNFIADPTKTVDGFLAHEVQDVVPEAITGEKDAVDDDGNPIYQGIDQSKLVPLLTAALQEAIGEIESLKARVAALESA